MLRHFFALSILMAFAGCTSAPERVSCAQRDWYESGRHDGSQGATLDRLAKYKVECNSEFNSAWESLYTNGRNAGLVEYCTPENAFQLGRMNISYMYTCPSTVEEMFLSAYRKGQEARQLEVANKKIDAKIDETLGRLSTAENKAERRELASEIEQLKQKRAQNEKTLDKVSK